jgi:hypothetical protein
LPTMKPTVYIETTVIGYLAMRVSNLLRVAANQQTTRDWWDNHRQKFNLFVSRFVIDECSDGDATAAQERLIYLEGIPLLEMAEEVNSLAETLVVGVPLPAKATVDALHVSVAAVNGIQYLLTWNCKHLANPALRPRIEVLCRERGYDPPVICTPQELLEIDDAD